VGELYATAVQNAKPQQRDYKLADGGGRCLLLRSTGRKLWRMNHCRAGDCKTLAIGVWHEVGLANTRTARSCTHIWPRRPRNYFGPLSPHLTGAECPPLPPPEIADDAAPKRTGIE